MDRRTVAQRRRPWRLARRCSEQGLAVALFPELSLTGYAIDDLLGQQATAGRHPRGAELAAATADLLFVVGAPLRQRDRLFNTAVVLHRGSVLGVVPKIHLPTYRGFYEQRQFASGDGIVGQTITVAGQPAPFGTDLLFTAADLPGLRARE